MYRTFMSAVRVGCVVAMIAFPAVVMAAGGTQGQTAATGGPNQQVNPQTPSASTGSQPKSQSTVAPQPTYQRLGRLIGARVVDIRGEKIGTIKDIVLGSQDDSVSYAVLSHGGLLGIGSKLFAVPWSEFQARPGKNEYVLDVRKAYLKDAAGFPKDHWPSQAQADWTQQVEKAYRQGRPMSYSASQAPSKQATTNALPVKYRRVSQLLRLPAKDYEGKDLGDLQDIVVDTQTHEVTYGVVILKTAPWSLHRQESIVPWSNFQVMPQLAALKLDADKEMLEAVAFVPGNFPNLSNPAYAQDIESNYQASPYWQTLGYVPGESQAQEMKSAKPAKKIDVSAWGPASKYNKRFDPALITTVRGKIKSIGTFSVGRHSVKGLRLQVKTSEGKTWTVYAGPRPYAESQGIALHYGDEVTVTGAPTRFGWLGEVLMASQIKDGKATLQLRNANGAPQWNVDELIGLGSSKR